MAKRGFSEAFPSAKANNASSLEGPTSEFSNDAGDTERPAVENVAENEEAEEEGPDISRHEDQPTGDSLSVVSRNASRVPPYEIVLPQFDTEKANLEALRGHSLGILNWSESRDIVARNYYLRTFPFLCSSTCAGCLEDARRMLGTHSAFEYEPIASNSNTIRLVILEPKRPEEDEAVIRCQIYPFTLRSKPSYQAISYTWGEEKQPRAMILVNNSEMLIRSNLYWALLYFRPTSNTHLYLWIDAMCIDQSNPDERGHQVGLMDAIYYRASSVLVWLGIMRVASENNRARKVDSGYPWSDPQIYDQIAALDYWTRTWIIQEILLPRKLMVAYGSAILDWDAFISPVYYNDFPDMSIRPQHNPVSDPGYLPSRPGAFKLSPQVLKLHRKRQNRNGSENRLERLLVDFQDSQCQEPRDKIFALLGLAHDCDGLVQADYTKSLYRLFCNLVKFFLSRKNLENCSTKDLNPPMRIVQFSRLVQKLLGNFYMDFSDTLYMMAYPMLVQARGAICATVLKLGPSQDVLFEFPNEAKKWKYGLDNSHYGRPGDSEKLRSAYDLYFDRLSNLNDTEALKFRVIDPSRYYSNVEETARPWNPEGEHWSPQDLDRPDIIHPGDSSSIDSNHFEFCFWKHPHIFLATNYLMGLAPPEAQSGDVLCAFWGCDVVALLRRDNNVSPGTPRLNDKVYRIIGRADLSTGDLQSGAENEKPWLEPSDGAVSVNIIMSVDVLHILTK